jgi:hypothetical protein
MCNCEIIYVLLKENPLLYIKHMAAGTAQSVQRLAMYWTVRRSNPGEGEIFRNVHQTSPEAHPAPYTMDTGSPSRGQTGRDVALTISI